MKSFKLIACIQKLSGGKVAVNFLLFFVYTCCFMPFGFSQIKTEAEVFVSPVSRTISVDQQISYTNTSQDTLSHLYLNDWANAFRDKQSPLGKHFSTTYIRKFHFSELDERGQTNIDHISDTLGSDITWSRLENQPDIVRVQPENKIIPGEKITFNISYTIRIPEDKFTHYGISPMGDINIKYWFITPAMYRNGWILESHKNLDDQFHPKIEAEIVMKIPRSTNLYTYLNQKELEDESYKTLLLESKGQTEFGFYLTQEKALDTYRVSGDSLQIYSDIKREDLPLSVREAFVERGVKFLEEKLGKYPHQNMLLTEADYKKAPINGLNELPDFLRPFSPEMLFELRLMKTLTHKYLKSTLLLNPRKEEWLINAMEVYLMMQYVEKVFPDVTLPGKLSNWFGLRWTHLSDLKFNAQYQFLFMHMNRLNLDQSLKESKDSLIKFNQEIANPYKAGIGFNYLNDFLEDESLNRSIKEFYETYRLKEVTSEDFKTILKKNSRKDVNWFFDEYVNTNVRLDFTIQKVEKQKDSLKVIIKNKEKNTMPVSLYGIDEKEKKVVSKHWVENTAETTSITIPRKSITRLGLNYEGVIPEINQRNNYKNLRSPFNKPLQFRLLKDVEDPHYTQFFVMPEFGYNVYDGLVLGTRITNEAVLRKRLRYNISPQYGFKSRELVGGLGLFYTQQFRNTNLHAINYGLSLNRYAYDHGYFYHRISPYLTFNWRHRYLRNKERHSLLLRSVHVHRDKSENLNTAENPNYDVFDAQYSYSNKDLIRSFSSTVDYQIGKKFSKVSLTSKFRRLFLNNRQIEFRLFAGAFLYNNTDKNSDYFNFALDRPSDYLFDYNYYGRSEGSGFFSQQFIESEGGFKSKINPKYANQWMTTLNTSVSLWKDILYVYGDVGMVKNRNRPLKIRHDSGVRVSLVQDYFEVFFPIYSSLGWEVGQSHYDRKIRFIISLDFETLMGIFSRTYY